MRSCSFHCGTLLTVQFVVFTDSTVAVAAVPSRRIRSSSAPPRSARSEKNAIPAPITSQIAPTIAPVGAGTNSTNATAPAMNPRPMTISIT